MRACYVEVEGASERGCSCWRERERGGHRSLLHSRRPAARWLLSVCVCCCSCNARSLSVDGDVDRLCLRRCLGLPRPPYSPFPSSARAIARSLTTKERASERATNFVTAKRRRRRCGGSDGVTEQVPILPTFAAFSVARGKREMRASSCVCWRR